MDFNHCIGVGMLPPLVIFGWKVVLLETLNQAAVCSSTFFKKSAECSAGRWNYCLCRYLWKCSSASTIPIESRSSSSQPSILSWYRKTTTRSWSFWICVSTTPCWCVSMMNSHSAADVVGEVSYTVTLSVIRKRCLLPGATGESSFLPWVVSSASRCQKLQRWTSISRCTIQESSLTRVCSSAVASAVQLPAYVDQ
jgi:hypothetical protein